ncbi:MAG: hypothetical protein HKN73_03590, partial [Gemmatimonadetes bacterium]|nr:hypothetical protein [Gemmatimonadota bacterium]
MSSIPAAPVQFGLAIHGGVGTLPPSRMSKELLADYEAALAASLAAGHGALAGGGSATDAVVEAVCSMEDSPLFNAGRGSNLDERGIATMDASIMRGEDRASGAVAALESIRNPVRAARLVMEESPHVFLIAPGAEAFARGRGLPTEPPDYFVTERRLNDLERARSRRSARPNVLGESALGEERTGGPEDGVGSNTGTVGAVALDRSGGLAAATSTGGMANKTWGRVGDTPIIGAGTYASETCAVSCTGWGERFIERAVAHQVHARMELAGATLEEAVQAVVWEELHTLVP